MSSRELSEWIAFARIHPLPDSYWQAGLIASVTANCYGANTTPEDFIPRTVQREEQSVDAALANFDAYALAYNARFEQ
jgi:hypothetical protein